MQKINKRISPNHISELSECEIFVFGSNIDGQHMGGAARYAYDNFGAEWGNGVGPQGQCYAIPTMHGPLSEIKPYVDDFIEYARQHPMNKWHRYSWRRSNFRMCLFLSNGSSNLSTTILSKIGRTKKLHQ